MNFKKIASRNVLAASLFSLIALMMSASAYADDAWVLPGGVFRLITGATFVNSSQEFDGSGEKHELGPELSQKVLQTGLSLGLPWSTLNPEIHMKTAIFRQDFAIEYGLTDLMSLSVQLPLYFNADVTATSNEDMKTALTTLNSAMGPGKVGELFQKRSQNGKKSGTLGDVLLGGKYQFLNSGSSPTSNDAETLRAAAALGLKLPTGSTASPNTNDISTTTASDTQSWILGARTYWDYQFTRSFYLNLYTEHEYRLPGSRKYLYTNELTGDYSVLDTTFKPGFYNHLELDFAFSPELMTDLSLETGIRFTGDYTAAGKYTKAPEAFSSIAGETTKGSAEYNVIPYLGVFYTGSPLPLKLKVVYYQPAAGENTYVLSGLSTVLQAYMKF
ncbi:MAG: hypothetical protein A2X94_13350 [Bdellovibrionales bacterium GWB1_55_8]|nr:MAG: hypothetical protein A2X94_13350 [Bdellovibrionales bacterium GWB1_55_8]